MQSDHSTFNKVSESGLNAKVWSWNLNLNYLVGAREISYTMEVRRRDEGIYLRTRLNPEDVDNPLFFKGREEERKVGDIWGYVTEEILNLALKHTNPSSIRAEVQYNRVDLTYHEVDGKIERCTDYDPHIYCVKDGTKFEIGEFVREKWFDFLYESDIGLAGERDCNLRSRYKKVL